VTVQAFLFGVIAAIGLTSVLAVAGMGAGAVLERRRLTAWGAEWRTTAALWFGQP
jgi:hypothetical protein